VLKKKIHKLLKASGLFFLLFLIFDALVVAFDGFLPLRFASCSCCCFIKLEKKTQNSKELEIFSSCSSHFLKLGFYTYINTDMYKLY